jgi:hypothetical protein
LKLQKMNNPRPETRQPIPPFRERDRLTSAKPKPFAFDVHLAITTFLLDYQGTKVTDEEERDDCQPTDQGSYYERISACMHT